MVLEEVEHVAPYVVNRLPAVCDALGALSATDVEQGVVEPHLVVEVVEVSSVDVVAIEAGVIDFGNEDDVGIGGLDLRHSPLPELDWHHLGHVAAEAVDALGCPVEQDMEHLVVGVGTIVQLHRLVPVVLVRPSGEPVVAGSFGRYFTIGAAGQDVVQVERFAREIVEVVVGRVGERCIVVFAEVSDTFRFGIGMVLASDMVGYEVDDDLQPCLVRPFYQQFELADAL